MKQVSKQNYKGGCTCNRYMPTPRGRVLIRRLGHFLVFKILNFNIFFFFFFFLGGGVSKMKTFAGMKI